MQRVIVPDTYRCPFCPAHQDEIFVVSRLVKQPICEPCAYFLDGFSDVEERRRDTVITAVEQHTGLPWRACQCILLRYQLEHWQHLRIDPPDWYRQGTTETPPLTKAEAIAEIDSQIEYVQALIDRFEQSLSQEILAQIQPYLASPYTGFSV